MHNYWPEFITVALVHFLAVASPGPDFAVMLRQALCQSRRNALLTAVGIGTGILIHVGYSLLGIGLIIQQSLVLFSILKIIGALYLTWIAIQCLRSKAGGIHVETENGELQSGLAAFRLGFLTNTLNPKATLFFVSLFSVIISPVRRLRFKRVMAPIWRWPRACGSWPWQCSSPCRRSARGLTVSAIGWTG